MPKMSKKLNTFLINNWLRKKYDLFKKLKKNCYIVKMSISDKEDIIANKNNILTTNEIYKHIYMDQFIEISKLAFSFLIYQFIIRILDLMIFDKYKHKKVLYTILLIVFLICFTFIAIRLFTYVKISSDKDELLKKLIK